MLAKRPEVIDDARVVADALGAPFGMTRSSSLCCGYPLSAAGDSVAFTQNAQKVAALDAFPEWVVLDPGCAYTLKVLYPKHGVRLSTQVRTLVEVLAEHLPPANERQKLPETVTYVDACHLGRGLGQYEEPRKLLRAAVATLRESTENREEAGCSGGGGLLPRTNSDVAHRVAKEWVEKAAPDGTVVVTACPTSKRMFERTGRASEDLMGLLRRWIEQRGQS